MIKYIAIVALLIPTICNAQQQKQGLEFLELVKLAEVYRSAPSLSFSMKYTYADSSAPSVLLEELTGVTRISNGKFWTMIDSVEMLQGSFYRLSVYQRDRTIVVSNLMKYDDLFRLPFLDSAFRTSNVGGVSIARNNDSTYEFTASFKPGSGFSKYSLKYDPRNFRTKEVKYFIRDTPREDASGLMTAVITVTMSNHSTQAVDQSLFNESRFLYKVNGSFVVNPAYAGFDIINNSSN